MLKKLELSTPTSCLNKAAPDEPIFVLRAKDPLAAITIQHWITMATGIHESPKLDEAHELSMKMLDWRKQNYPEPPKSAPKVEQLRS